MQRGPPLCSQCSNNINPLLAVTVVACSCNVLIMREQAAPAIKKWHIVLVLVICVQMRREPVQVDSLAKQGEGSVRTAVVGPTGAALDEAGVPTDAPVMVMLHSFDSRWAFCLLLKGGLSLDAHFPLAGWNPLV
eukprot:scaffold197515_cov30-Tisochrysis_lutea.AAC.1